MAGPAIMAGSLSVFKRPATEFGRGLDDHRPPLRCELYRRQGEVTVGIRRQPPGDMVGEYVDLNPYLTTDGGHTYLTISPSCFSVIGPFDLTKCNPTPRFMAPLATDVNNPNHWGCRR